MARPSSSLYCGASCDGTEEAQQRDQRLGAITGEALDQRHRKSIVIDRWHEPGTRDPLQALNLLLAAGANPMAIKRGIELAVRGICGYDETQKDGSKKHVKGELDTVTASMAKYWLTDELGCIVDRCLQLFGGYGFMDEYPISRIYRDARVMRIYAGTNEIMKLLIARSL